MGLQNYLGKFNRMYNIKIKFLYIYFEIDKAIFKFY